MSTGEQLRGALHRACAYLLGQQRAAGQFVDYALPVGPSDQWMTGVAGLGLAAAAARALHPGADAGARRAAAWLERARGYPAGWGYNGITGPDADSTAHALQLFAALGQACAARDVGWLMARRRHGAGFATYDRGDGWGEPHPDVTPVAFLALPWEERLAYGDELAAWALGQRGDDGAWPAYWWRSTHYSTYWNLRMLRALGCPVPVRRGVPLAEVHSTFDLAHVIGILHLAGEIPDPGATREAHPLVARLMSLQRRDGGWDGSDDLCVTDARYRQPWCEPRLADDRSRRYRDLAGILTTATVVRVIADLT